MKKVRSTQRFSCVLFTFFKRVTHKNKSIISNSSLVALFCKGKSLCTVSLFQKSNTRTQKYFFNFFSCCSLLQRKISVYRLPFSKEEHTNNEIDSTNQNLCVLFTFFKRVSHKHKNIISIHKLIFERHIHY